MFCFRELIHCTCSIVVLRAHAYLLYIYFQIPQDNYGAIVGKAIELWEANGSPLLPSAKMEDSPSHELHNKIEDYT